MGLHGSKARDVIFGMVTTRAPDNKTVVGEFVDNNEVDPPIETCSHCGYVNRGKFASCSTGGCPIGGDL